MLFDILASSECPSVSLIATMVVAIKQLLMCQQCQDQKAYYNRYCIEVQNFPMFIGSKKQKNKTNEIFKDFMF